MVFFVVYLVGWFNSTLVHFGYNKSKYGFVFFFPEQVVSHSAKFSPPLKCCKSNSSYPQRKDQRREEHANEA